MVNRRPTLRQVATLADLSPSAVSLALRSHPSIPAATRARVEKIAAEIGYHPDPALSALRIYRKDIAPTQNRSTLAVIDNWPNKGLTEWNPASRAVFQGAVAQAEKLGYRLESFWMRDFKSHQKASDVLYSRGVKGLILEALPQGLGHLRLQWERFCSVSYSFDFVSPALNRVTADDFDDMITMRRKLAQLGYKRIGLLTESRNDRASRYRAFAANLLWESRHPSRRQPVPPLTVHGFDDCRRRMLPWYREFRPDVIVGFTSGNLHTLLEHGIRVPQDVAFVCREILENETSITGIRLGHHNIGTVTVNLLHAMILRGEYGIPEIPQTILIRNQWNEGTTAPKIETSPPRKTKSS